MDKQTKLSPAMEDYLETIYSLKREKGLARVGEVAKRLKVKSPTANTAIKYLSNNGFVIHEKYGYVDLTKEGEKAASVIQGKHDILFRFLTEFLMLDKKMAEKEACSIEHAISQETFDRLTKFFEFLEADKRTGTPKISSLFETYLETGKRIKCDGEIPEKLKKK